MRTEVNRRAFVKASVLASAGAAVVAGLSDAAGAAETPPGPAGALAPKDTLPTGKIGKLTISRMLLGGNLLTHYTHSRDLQYVYSLAKHYNTDEKILETLAVAEAHGINTLSVHTAGNIVKLLKRHRDQKGGKMQWIICPTEPIEPGLDRFGKQVQSLVDDGVDAIYIWGVQADGLVDGQIELMAKAVELVKSHGIACGVGGHRSEVVVECEKAKVPNDFYIKTFHHHRYPSAKLNHDSSWCADPDKLIEIMKGVQKPWIAFKTMAAGAIPPADAFSYVFQNGADFVLAGMFDYEVAEDVRICKSVLAGVKDRSRPWRA
jgi:hypothetical protein